MINIINNKNKEYSKIDTNPKLNKIGNNIVNSTSYKTKNTHNNEKFKFI
jgi:hypothetical protein